MRGIRVNQVQAELLLGVGLAVGIELELALGHDLASPAQAVAAALIALPVAVRFRWPLIALIVGGAAALAQTALSPSSDDPILGIVATLLLLYGVGSRTRGWRFWTGAALSLAGGTASTVIRKGAVTSDIGTIVLLTGAGLLIGRALGTLQLETDVLEERATELERERDERARQAVEEERGRIARELHDVIGHSISVMGVQAGAVRRVLKPDQERERDALLSVEQTGRQAVAEMRRLIGLLRTEEHGISDPSPSLKRVEQLAAEMRQAGLDVELTVEGDLRALPPGADLAGYRIVQEALTNALKHAPGAHVCATVRTNGRELLIDVLDDGPGRSARANGHLGHGLLGMRERTALYGGKLTAGPRDGGGFGVKARIPIETA